MIGINYEVNKFIYIHDGRVYNFEEIIEHIRSNGHERELIGITAPNMRLLNKGREKKAVLESLFGDKEGSLTNFLNISI